MITNIHQPRLSANNNNFSSLVTITIIHIRYLNKAKRLKISRERKFNWFLIKIIIKNLTFNELCSTKRSSSRQEPKLIFATWCIQYYEKFSYGKNEYNYVRTVQCYLPSKVSFNIVPFSFTI